MAEGKFSIFNFMNVVLAEFYPLYSLWWLPACLCLVLMLPSQLKGFGTSPIGSFICIKYLFLVRKWLLCNQPSTKSLYYWSLAVEEQFYIFFPLFVLMFWKLGVPTYHFLLIIFLISFSSPTGQHFLGHQKITSGGFFLIPTRAWSSYRFIISIYLKFYGNQIRNWRKLLSFVGLMLILFSIVFFDRTTPFPSIFTLVPVLGTDYNSYFSDTIVQNIRVLW